jgi:hypothetical protein
VRDVRGVIAPHAVPAPAIAVALAGAFFLCHAPLGGSGLGAALAGTASLSIAVLLLLALVARLAASPGRDGALLGCALVAAGLAVIARRADGGPLTELSFDLALATAAAAAGRLFANQVQQAWWIVPLGLTAGVTDLLSVFVPGAPTQRMLATKSWVLDYLLLVWPALDGRAARPFLGVSDLVIAGILYGLTVRFGFPPWRSFAALAAGLLTSLVLAGLGGIGLPAIPFLFVFHVAAQRRELMESFRARPR